MHAIITPAIGFKVYTHFKIFGRNFNKIQARDDEIEKPDV